MTEAMDSWRARVATLRADTYAVYLACRDPRVPRLPKLVTAIVVAYALSPIDLIPDFIPIVGYLDDLILVPIGLSLAIRLIPPSILEEHRAHAKASLSQPHPISRLGAVIVVVLWIVASAWLASVVWFLIRAFR